MTHTSALTAIAALGAAVVVTSCGVDQLHRAQVHHDDLRPATAVDVTSGWCDRSGCDAFDHPSIVSSIATGIVGVIALSSDTASKDCSLNCPFSWAPVGIWRTPAPIVDEPAAQAVVDAKPPDITFSADRRYEQTLAPGDYLICGDRACVPLTIGPNDVYTVNFLLQMASTEIRVWAPTGGQPLTLDPFQIAWR